MILAKMTKTKKAKLNIQQKLQ